MNTKSEPRYKVGDKVIILDEVGKKGEGTITQFRYNFGYPESYEYHVLVTNPDTENWFSEDEIVLIK